ncbi:thymidylate synthase, partial [Carnobacterium jeotgali]
MESEYLNLARKVLEVGNEKTDRTGTGTKSLFGHQMRFNLQEGFPLLTTKRVPFSLIKSELLWFIKGNTNIRYLLQHNNHIWDEWAFERFVKSEDYKGPDMTNFGRKSLI